MLMFRVNDLLVKILLQLCVLDKHQINLKSHLQDFLLDKILIQCTHV